MTFTATGGGRANVVPGKRKAGGAGMTEDQDALDLAADWADIGGNPRAETWHVTTFRWDGEIDSGFMLRKPELQLQIGISGSLAICAANLACGSPEPEKIGSFCPRTNVFKPSMALMPVSMKSRGNARATGFIGRPSIG